MPNIACRSLLVHGLAALLLVTGTLRPAAAEIIGTPAALASIDRAAAVERIEGALARDEVRAKLADLGVAPEAIDARLSSLTDAELAAFADQVDHAPAGGILGLIGAVFVVLLVLELVGVIDIFKKVG